MAKVLLFQCENENEIRQILTPMKIQAVSVPKTKFHMALRDLAKGKMMAGISVVRIRKAV